MFDQMAQWSYKSQIQMQNQKLMERDYVKKYQFEHAMSIILIWTFQPGIQSK